MNGETHTPMTVVPVAALDVESRSQFIMRTYLHLFGAIALFTGLEILYFKTGVADSILNVIGGTSWLLILGAFMLVSWLASRTAMMTRSLPMQYLALAGYVTMWSLIFVPMLAYAQFVAKGNVIQSAALTTIIGFAGLTLIAFGTRKDFSFLRGILMWAGFSAFLAIVAAVIFGFELGTWFSVAMVVFAGAAILHDTSSIIHSYPQDRYVSAAIQLFASVALMFYYLLRLFSSRN